MPSLMAMRDQQAFPVVIWLNNPDMISDRWPLWCRPCDRRELIHKHSTSVQELVTTRDSAGERVADVKVIGQRGRGLTTDDDKTGHCLLKTGPD